MGEQDKKSKSRTGENKTFMSKVTGFVKSKAFSIILSVIHILLTIVMLGVVLYINMLPLRFFIPICLVLLLICAMAFLMAYSRKCKYVGKFMSLVMIIVTSIGTYYAVYASGTFEGLAGADTKKDVINIYVMKADSAQDLTEAKDYTFGILSVLDRANTDKTVDKIEEQLGESIKTEEYEGYIQLAEALYEGEVEAIILNSAYVAQIEENEEFASFSSLTRVLLQTTHESQLTVDNSIDVSKEPFAMYLSGIDIEGEVSTTSRSDVNIIAIINPETRQILLVNTPRDYWVPLSISDGVKDKLTHAGIYGIDVSMDTLEMLYDVELDYFFRINFTGFKEVIDALGGITVYSEYDFHSTYEEYSYVEGYNQLDGAAALAFVRERYAFLEGDNQRGRNQMAMIQALVDKAASSSLLNNFTEFMDSIEGSFETSMSSQQISAFVRMQLAEGGSWNVVTYSVTGEGDHKPVYSMSSTPYVTIPDEDSVWKAKKLIDMVYAGEILSDEIIENLDIDDVGEEMTSSDQLQGED